jgi:hypothetical protein
MTSKCPYSDQHKNHLCELTAGGLHQRSPKEYHNLVKNPRFVCKSCGRVAAESNRLCLPVPLGAWEE